jgi:hypothetical protein
LNIPSGDLAENPVTIRAYEITHNSLGVEWDAVDDVDGYIVRWGLSEDDVSNIAMISSSLLSYSIVGLFPNVTYYIYVSSYVHGNETSKILTTLDIPGESDIFLIASFNDDRITGITAKYTTNGFDITYLDTSWKSAGLSKLSSNCEYLLVNSTIYKRNSNDIFESLVSFPSHLGTSQYANSKDFSLWVAYSSVANNSTKLTEHTFYLYTFDGTTLTQVRILRSYTQDITYIAAMSPAMFISNDNKHIRTYLGTGKIKQSGVGASTANAIEEQSFSYGLDTNTNTWKTEGGMPARVYLCNNVINGISYIWGLYYPSVRSDDMQSYILRVEEMSGTTVKIYEMSLDMEMFSLYAACVVTPDNQYVIANVFNDADDIENGHISMYRIIRTVYPSGFVEYTTELVSRDVVGVFNIIVGNSLTGFTPVRVDTFSVGELWALARPEPPYLQVYQRNNTQFTLFAEFDGLYSFPVAVLLKHYE